MKLFMAGLDTETNTYSPIPTGIQSFCDVLLAHGDATSRPLNYCSAQLAVWRRKAARHGHTVVESLCAVAEPAGIVTRETYESFRSEIVNDLRAALPVDGVLLALHGAMVADGYLDVEGDLLEAIRQVAGQDVPIGAELDLHAHLTQKMVEAADILVAYKEYPHTDIETCAEQLFELIEQTASGNLKPAMAVADCRMIGIYRTQENPLRQFIDRIKALQGHDGIASISVIHGFPWGDVPEAGAKVLVVADLPARAKAEALVESLAKELWQMRDRVAATVMSIDAALDAAESMTAGPVVLADIADNPGGGAPGDSTFLLRHLLERRMAGAVFALLWDPMAVRFCQDAGEGATLSLRIGGKSGPTSGAPVDVNAKVVRLARGLTQRFGSAEIALGDVAWISVQGVDIVLNTQRTQAYNFDFLQKLGIDAHARKMIVLKSTNHFHAAFAPIARKIMFVDSPGTVSTGFSQLPRRWPLHRE
jgi:microcystin degradation protein MlrC